MESKKKKKLPCPYLSCEGYRHWPVCARSRSTSVNHSTYGSSCKCGYDSRAPGTPPVQLKYRSRGNFYRRVRQFSFPSLFYPVLDSGRKFGHWFTLLMSFKELVQKCL